MTEMEILRRHEDEQVNNNFADDMLLSNEMRICLYVLIVETPAFVDATEMPKVRVVVRSMMVVP